MAPDPGAGARLRTVGVPFARLVPDAAHAKAIGDTVERVHRATLNATELLGLHARDRLANHGGEGLEGLFDANWLLNAYYEVTFARGKPRVVEELRATRDAHMPAFEAVDRSGLGQVLRYECRNLAAVASNNVWMHFRRRVLGHVRLKLALDDAAFNALTKEERRARRLALMQVADDLLRPPSEPSRCPEERRAWVAAERQRLGVDAAVGDWDGKPIEYHLKARPHRFLKAMHLMTTEREAAGRSAFALFPLRRTLVPRHVRFDQEALRQLLCLGSSEHAKQAAKRRKTEAGRVDLDAPDPAEPTKRERRSKEDMADEKAELFAQVLDLRAAKLSQRDRFDWAFTTDGVCARLQCTVPKRGEPKAGKMPTRGRFAIDELKSQSRASLKKLHVVGVDPGKRELVVAVDQDDPKGSPVVRYTQRQRQRDLRSRQYADEARCSKPADVGLAEAELSDFNSRAADLATFKRYCAQRRVAHAVCLAHYADVEFRRRRWKTAIKTQQSEERLYARLRAMHGPDDKRALVLAYGSWGAVAGRPGAAANRGNAPCIGVGLMNKLAKRFVVALTPEQYTSKTCCKCLRPCGPWAELEEKMGRKVRGVRVCQNEECRLPQNRDRTGAANIGLQFCRLYEGNSPIRTMTDEDMEFNRLNTALCVACD